MAPPGGGDVPKVNGCGMNRSATFVICDGNGGVSEPSAGSIGSSEARVASAGLSGDVGVSEPSAESVGLSEARVASAGLSGDVGLVLAA